MERLRKIYEGLGLPLTILLAVILGLLLWFAIGGIWGSVDSYMYQRENNALKAEAEALRQKSAAKEAEAAQAIGAAAVYKEQADKVQQELNELLAIRPELQKQIVEAQKRVEEIRNRPDTPINGNIRQRVDDVGAKLNTLYPGP
jgi:uncharacterized protein HemX